jgi:hypothetical protein
MALTIGAVAGLAAGLLISTPWAGGQGEDPCQPAQTVTDQMVRKLERINRKLDKAIEDEPNLRLSDFYGRIAEIRMLKHELIQGFPPVFGLGALKVYLDLEAIDNGLDDAREAKSRDGGIPRGHLRAARRAKDALERALSESPCRPR